MFKALCNKDTDVILFVKRYQTRIVAFVCFFERS